VDATHVFPAALDKNTTEGKDNSQFNNPSKGTQILAIILTKRASAAASTYGIPTKPFSSDVASDLYRSKMPILHLQHYRLK
jgi:hypothetical protein